jgi:hypothetical protein
MQDLSVQVAPFDHIIVRQPDGPDSGSGQVQAGRAAQPAEAGDEDTGLVQTLLPLLPDTGKDGLADVPKILFSSITH